MGVLLPYLYIPVLLLDAADGNGKDWWGRGD